MRTLGNNRNTSSVSNMSEKRIIKFDVMNDGRFVCTMRMPITLDMITGYDGDTPIVDARKIQQYVEQKRPSLKRVKYNICF